MEDDVEMWEIINKYRSRGHGELEVGQVQGSGGDMNSKEGGLVPEGEFNRRIHGSHVGGDARGICPSLDVEVLECDALGTKCICININSFTQTQT